MKHILLSTSVFALLIPFGGCKKAEAARPTIGVAIHDFDDSHMAGVRRSIEANAVDRALMKIMDSRSQQSMQNDQIDALLGQKVTALAICPVDRGAAGALLEKGKAKKVPVVFFDREPQLEDMQKWDRVYYVGTRPSDSGTIQAEILIEHWKANPAADRNKDGKMQYAFLAGKPGDQDALLRAEACVKAIAAAGIASEELAEAAVGGNAAAGREKIAALVAKSGNRIEAILCSDEDDAFAAIDALKAAGWFKGKKYQPVVSSAGSARSFDALEAGTLLGTVLEDAAGEGKAVFDLAFALAGGKDAAKAGWKITDGKFIWIPSLKVTRENYRTIR